jgi:tRNA threonylcarbamoyladenosine biosynthesis protein TsaE
MTISNVAAGTWSTSSASETMEIGQSVGARFTGGEIILLDGPLGAGKTVFVKGIAVGLEIDTEEVTSPSFTLVNQYEGRLRLFHVDLYRLDDGGQAANAVDLEELLTDEKAVVVIEWGERLKAYPLPPAIRIFIAGDGDDLRTISIAAS